MEAAANRNRIIWLLPLVALAAGYAAGYAHRAGDSGLPDGQRAPDSTTAPAAKRIARTAPPHADAQATPPVVLPAMPPDQAPLAESFDALAARARGGDGRAAVRLADATLHCARRDYAHSMADAVERHPPKNGDPTGRARRAAEARAFLDETEALCAGATREQTASAREWLERAAASGDPGSQTCYAHMGASEPWLPEFASDAWIDAMQRYRENARAYAESAFAAGVPQAAYTLYEMSAGRYAMISYLGDPALAPDYPKAYALALFEAERLGAGADSGGDPDAAAMWRIRAKLLERELSPADIERARNAAAAATARMPAHDTPSLPCDGWING
jgi:hypothetical protein